jgi:4'-phosphopantetheinyl transferase
MEPVAARRVSGSHAGWGTTPLPQLSDRDDVHVWFAALDLAKPGISEGAKALSAEERTRAERFRFERHRDRFIAARGTLRMVLGGLLGVSPAEVVFAYGPHGKPHLAGEGAARGIRFNLSHSHDAALIAVARDREVGVDIERMRPLSELRALERRCFSDRVAAALRDLPPERELQEFFRWWARREAFQKATGEGLAAAAEGFDAEPGDGEGRLLALVPSSPEERGRWTLADLDPHPDFAAALAVEGAGWRLHRWRWPAGAAD